MRWSGLGKGENSKKEDEGLKKKKKDLLCSTEVGRCGVYFYKGLVLSLPPSLVCSIGVDYVTLSPTLLGTVEEYVNLQSRSDDARAN